MNLFSPKEDSITSGDVCYVIDGGYLLHKVVWRKGKNIFVICHPYVQYVLKNFQKDATVIYDRYAKDVASKSTKPAERFRRATKVTSPDILFDLSISATVPQDTFLGKENNKLRIIDMLKMIFRISGFNVEQHDEDADVIIVQNALEMSKDYESVFIVVEDTDLLIILSGVTKKMIDNVYFIKPGRGKSKTQLFSSTNLKNPSHSKHILVSHAMTGCNTTPALFDHSNMLYHSIFDLKKPGLEKCIYLFRKFLSRCRRH